MKQTLSLTIEGSVPSKKNKWRHSKNGHVYLPADAKREIDEFTMMAINARNRSGLEAPMRGKIKIMAVIYTKRRADLDNQFTTVLDALQTAKIIENDGMVDAFEVSRQAVILGDEERVYVHLEARK